MSGDTPHGVEQMENNLKKIKEIILRKLEHEFNILKVIDVMIRKDFDSDGGKVLLIDVVFEGERRNVDAHALTGAVRKVRPALIENDEDAFPVFSFIAVRELEAAGRDAR
jgi:hypothetical protein